MQFLKPQARLGLELLYGGQGFLFCAGTSRPHYAKAGTYLAVLDCQQISRPQLPVNTGEQRSVVADIAGGSSLGKSPALGINAPNEHRKAGSESRFAAAIKHKIFSLPKAFLYDPCRR